MLVSARCLPRACRPLIPRPEPNYPQVHAFHRLSARLPSCLPHRRSFFTTMPSQVPTHPQPMSVEHVLSDQAVSRSKVLCFIGGGNMAEAILGGLIAEGFKASHLRVSDPVEARCHYMHEKYGVPVYTDNDAALRGLKGKSVGHVTQNYATDGHAADIVILAVKPQVMQQVLAPISTVLMDAQPLIISIAAGIRISDILRWVKQGATTGSHPPVVRCMPNTPSLVGAGASGLYAEPSVTSLQRAMTSDIMGAVSKTYWLDREDLIDAVTAVSGSGPAYFFLMLEAMEEGGVQAGLPRELAGKLAAQTCLGAAQMVLGTTDDNAASLRKKVTSPKGTTEAAVNTMITEGMQEAVIKGVLAASHRSKELADILGQQ